MIARGFQARAGKEAEMKPGHKLRVAVNGYGAIGRRIADAIQLQDDMMVFGICDVATDWRMRVAQRKGFFLFGATPDQAGAMRNAGLEIDGILDDLIRQVHVVVDCTPNSVVAENAAAYRRAGVTFVVEGSKEHAATGHSFVAEANYATARALQATRVVSCSTTSIVRTLTALKRAGLLRCARGTLLRPATDPWEGHLGGIMNTHVQEHQIPSHEGPDAQSVDPELDVVTMAVKVPETFGHLHCWSVQLTRRAEKTEIISAFASSSRVALITRRDGLSGIGTVRELMADLGRPHESLYEVALWDDMVSVQGDEAFYAYLVDDRAIVIPETIDAIRALTGLETDPNASIARTNASLGIRTRLDREAA
jgi:glyceraldehyde-3-phosphate dehydrogenase (NAD(P))